MKICCSNETTSIHWLYLHFKKFTYTEFLTILIIIRVIIVYVSSNQWKRLLNTVFL